MQPKRRNKRRTIQPERHITPDYQRLAPWPRLPENRQIDAIEASIAAYTHRHGIEPVNVSHWDPSVEFAQKLKLQIPIELIGDPIPYQYSYMIEGRDAVLRKLGIVRPSVSSLFTENGSTSIAAAANFLLLAKVTEVKLLCPSYFITAHNLRRLGLPTTEVHVPRRGGHYHWPNRLCLSRGQALWITNPVYNTGDYSLEDYISKIQNAADSGALVVVDEALAFPPTRIANELVGHPNVLAIYTPHKTVCINRMKFSIIAFHVDLEDLFDDWADVLSGGLSLSSSIAIRHFLSTAFDRYSIEFVQLIEQARQWHKRLTSEHERHIQTDNAVRGHFLTVYFPQLSADLGESISFIESTMDATGATFIPGTRNSFDAKLGLCFRVNLAQDSLRFRGALARLYNRLAG
jgi:histidinol-phosphate/aromatic aminotransferase/cobyric acid decarboxylase-like protein